MAVTTAAVPGRRASIPAAPNRLVGRDTELAALARLLAGPDTRLVTLTGPPGVGKTRLAVAAADAIARQHPDGVVFVDLTVVRDAGLAVSAVAGLLGVPDGPAGAPTERLVAAVAGRDLLLVLDNCEHVLDAAPTLTAPLAACPGLRILATSRERLRVAAEHELPVPPLAVPGDASVGLDRFATIPAVAMLLARVRSFAPDFAPTPANRVALAEICARLDGLPLALELAAARFRHFTPEEMTFRLRFRMDLLTAGARDVPERHRTLRAALRWSHDLLSADERTVFRRLAVFVGGATVGAVQDVCLPAEPVRPDSDAVDLVSSLIDKSLVHRTTRPDGVAEVRMLEGLREYAAELLTDHHEMAATRARHTRHFGELATRTIALIGSPTETRSVDWVGYEQGNLRNALEHSRAAGDPSAALPLAVALGWYSYTRGRIGEGDAMFGRALADVEGSTAPPPDGLLARAHVLAGYLAFAHGDFDRAEKLVACGLELDELVGARYLTAIGAAIRGHLARVRGRHEEAVALHERAARLHEEAGNPSGVAWSRYDLGLLARRRGETEAAAAHLREGLRRFRDLDYGWAIGCCAWALATVCLRRGETDEAARLLDEALHRHAALDDGCGTAPCLEASAAVAARRGSPARAARLLGAAAALRDQRDAPLPEEDRADHASLTRVVMAALGQDSADRERRAGRALSAAAAVALARAALAPATSRGSEGPATDPLTERERQVARLIVDGRTNRQIGRTLGIAEKTTEVHVHNLIRKLRMRSRTEVAAWAVQCGLG